MNLIFSGIFEQSNSKTNQICGGLFVCFNSILNYRSALSSAEELSSVLSAREAPQALHPVSQKCLQCSLRNSSSVWSDWRWPCLVHRREIVEHFLILRLSPPSDRWCDVFGFVPAGSHKPLNTSDPPRRKPLVMVPCPPVCVLGHCPAVPPPPAVWSCGRRN